MSLRLITGKVRSGKTSYIIREIRDAVINGTEHSLLLVPEQYSHEAERELCEACGDRLSLYAEVMSFSGFARWSMGKHGGGAEVRLDKAGRLLCMASALKELQPTLRLFGRAAENIDLQQLILQEADTLRAAGTESGTLRELAEELDGELGAKLKELALRSVPVRHRRNRSPFLPARWNCSGYRSMTGSMSTVSSTLRVWSWKCCVLCCGAERT